MPECEDCGDEYDVDDGNDDGRHVPSVRPRVGRCREGARKVRVGLERHLG